MLCKSSCASAIVQLAAFSCCTVSAVSEPRLPPTDHYSLLLLSVSLTVHRPPNHSQLRVQQGGVSHAAHLVSIGSGGDGRLASMIRFREAGIGLGCQFLFWSAGFK